jgi:N-acetylmuramoyl-L-alanine amidase
MRRVAWAVPVLATVLFACTIGSAGQAVGQLDATPHADTQAAQSADTQGAQSVGTQAAAAAALLAASQGAAAAASQGAAAAAPQAIPDAGHASTAGPPTLPAATGGGPGRFPPTAKGILDGRVVLVDPGHNGGNFAAPSIINRLIWNGRESETCDTTGTETDGGYTEALFNWHVALYLTADLRAEGATVVLTRTSNTGVGPCVTERAAIGNEAHANAAVSIHADGGPPGGRGFAILEPVADGINDAIVAPSAILGADLRAAFEKWTSEPVSSYDGVNGIQPRDDLAGINLSTVPKVFIECANMRDAADAALVTSLRWQALAARAIAAGLASFLAGRD